MGGSGEPRTPRSRPESSSPPETPRRAPDADDAAVVDLGVGARQESGDAGRKHACPSDFPAEVTHIPEEMQATAAGIAVGSDLSIALRDEDPAFLFEGEILGWLADNIEEVTECLQAGWHYRGIVRANQSTPAGAIITTQVFGTSPV
jgi:hypothetical protein